MPCINQKPRAETERTNSSAAESYNRVNKNAPYAIRVSIGDGTKETEDQQIQDVTRAAEEYLNSRKLLSQNSAHSTAISSIMAALYTKSQETEKYGQRLGMVCRLSESNRAWLQRILMICSYYPSFTILVKLTLMIASSTNPAG